MSSRFRLAGVVLVSMLAVSTAQASASTRSKSTVQARERATFTAKLGAAHPVQAQASSVEARAARGHSSPLGILNARRAATRYVLKNWDALIMLPYYSLADRWHGVDSATCFRWGRYQVDCVMSTTAENYYYDPLAEEYTGYAWCVGTVDVHKSSRSRRTWVVDEGDESCDSTNDLSY